MSRTNVFRDAESRARLDEARRPQMPLRRQRSDLARNIHRLNGKKTR